LRRRLKKLKVGNAELTKLLESPLLRVPFLLIHGTKKIISAEIRCPDHVYADAADFRCWRFWRIFSAAIAGVIESLALDAFSLTRYMISLD
jgi:hypothetical protein